MNNKDTLNLTRSRSGIYLRGWSFFFGFSISILLKAKFAIAIEFLVLKEKFLIVLKVSLKSQYSVTLRKKKIEIFFK